MSRIINLSKTSSPKIWAAIRRYACAKSFNEMVPLAQSEGAKLYKPVINQDGSRMSCDDKMLFNAMMYFGTKHNDELLEAREIRKQQYAKKISDQRKQATRERIALKRNPIEQSLVLVKPQAIIVRNRYYDLPKELQTLIKTFNPSHIFHTHLKKQSTATNHQLYDFQTREVNYANHAIKCIGKVEHNNFLWEARVKKYNLENYRDTRYASIFSGHRDFVTQITYEFMIRNFDLCVKLIRMSQILYRDGCQQIEDYNLRVRNRDEKHYKKPGMTFTEFGADCEYHTWYHENNFRPNWKKDYAPTYEIVMNKRFTKMKKVSITKISKCMCMKN